MRQYWLSSHVYVCITDDHAVLLDLRRDKYLGIGRRQLPVLAAQVQGWPASGAEQGDAAGLAADPAGNALLEKFCTDGMLTTDPAAGKPAQPQHMPWPQAALTHPDPEIRPPVRWTHVLRFAWASVYARLSLRWRPLEQVVARVSRRKARRARERDAAAARELVAIFIYLRPLIFGARDECLFDSLALVEFLAAYGFYPAWLFGVQTAPFAAHSWVQQDTVIFNDAPEYVRRFTPILVV
jgi:hypothetical protein